MSIRLPVVAVTLLLLAGCSGRSADTATAPVVLAAGLETMAPAATDTVSARVDLQRVELGGLHPLPARTYQLTTPAGVPFTFDVLTVASGNAGWAKVSVAHLLDGTATPIAGVTSLAAAGVIVNGPGLFIDGRNTNWMGVEGNGFSRLSIRGKIDRPQVLAFETETPANGTTGEVLLQTALVELAIGPVSAINAAAAPGSNHPDVVADATVYSSDSWRFGMPAIAVSGDRASVVVYEGDRANATARERYEMRLQQDAVTGVVTGGGARAAGYDSGNWRDHEIAALFNVLAVAQGRDDAVELRLSFDRGATFAQDETFVAVGGTVASTRLVQMAMAADYSLALAYWQTDGGQRSELMLVDGWPSAFDGGGSPTAYTFAAPVAIHTVNDHVVPLPMGMQWSDGGDLVVGHAYTYTTAGGIWTGEVVTEFHCATRPWQGQFADVVVDAEIMFARDPSVALMGSGASLQVFYAYESLNGISLARLVNGQVDSQSYRRLGLAGAHAPSVFARERNGAVRVDVLYIADAAFGLELHASRWLAFGGSPEETFRLSTAEMTPTAMSNPQLGYGYRIRQLGWFGYDAVLDAGTIVVAMDEEQFDAAAVCLGAPLVGTLAGTSAAGFPILPPTFSTAAPPPLAPGMTLPVPAVNPSHRHQLRIVRLQ